MVEVRDGLMPALDRHGITGNAEMEDSDVDEDVRMYLYGFTMGMALVF